MSDKPDFPVERLPGAAGRAYDGVMDFEHVLTELLEAFAQQRIRYAVVGGFALGALGVPRMTMDLDFLVHQDDLDALHTILTTRGYQRSGRTDNVSQYVHSTRAGGVIDILHAFRAFSVAMLQRTRPHPIFDGRRTIQVVSPEDLIGLKVQAMANNPHRAAQERADIESLAGHYGTRLDWTHIQEFYDLFEMGQEAKQLQERFGHAQ